MAHLPLFTKLAQMSVIGCILAYTIFCWHEEHMAFVNIHRDMMQDLYSLDVNNKSNLSDSNELELNKWYNHDKEFIIPDIYTPEQMIET